MECRDLHIRFASVTLRLESANASAVDVKSTHVKVLDCHGLVTSEAGYWLVHAMRTVLSSYFAVAFMIRAVNQGVVAVDVDVVEQVASLYLFVAALGRIRALDDEIIQDIEQKLGG